jgi:hypothetical protein
MGVEREDNVTHTLRRTRDGTFPKKLGDCDVFDDAVIIAGKGRK